MITICEGLDKCGKSTFISNHAFIWNAHAPFCADITNMHADGSYGVLTTLDALHDFNRVLPANVALHFDDKDQYPLESFWKCLELSKRTHLFLDRSFISELVYGRVYRGGTRLSLSQEQLIISELKQTPHEILYFRRKLDTKYFESLSGEDNYEKEREKIIKVNDEYNRVMRQYSKAGLNVYEISFNIKRS